MRRGFALAGGANADEAGLLAELSEVGRAEVAHAGLDAADQLRQDLLHRAADFFQCFDAFRRDLAARYGHTPDPSRKVAPEGVEALKEVSGSVEQVLAQLIGGIQSGMGYLGAANLAQLREKARFIRVSPAGQREAAPHDVVELKTAS